MGKRSAFGRITSEWSRRFVGKHSGANPRKKGSPRLGRPDYREERTMAEYDRAMSLYLAGECPKPERRVKKAL